MEEVIYALLSELKGGPKKRDELSKTELKGWDRKEIEQVMNNIENIGLIEGEDRLELTKKGKFHWKRIRRKHQEFI